MSKQETWTLMAILNWSTDYLANKNIEDAKTVVEWLLCDTLSCSRMDLYLQFDRPMSEEELAKFRPMLLKCATKQPVQQVVGNCEFYGLKLAINEDVLVPRPETERLVEETLKLAPKILETIEPKTISRKIQSEDKENSQSETVTLPKELHILDIGSGSACIALALAINIPQAKITAIEKSAEAVEIMHKNINFYNLKNRISVVHADIMEYKPEQTFHIIVSNPPYIAKNEMPGLNKNVTYYEPHMALSDKDDGLNFYRFFAKKFASWMDIKAYALLEYGGNHQTAELRTIFSDFSQKIVKDYQNDDRVIILKSKEA